MVTILVCVRSERTPDKAATFRDLKYEASFDIAKEEGHRFDKDVFLKDIRSKLKIPAGTLEIRVQPDYRLGRAGKWGPTDMNAYNVVCANKDVTDEIVYTDEILERASALDIYVIIKDVVPADSPMFAHVEPYRMRVDIGVFVDGPGLPDWTGVVKKLVGDGEKGNMETAKMQSPLASYAAVTLKDHLDLLSFNEPEEKDYKAELNMAYIRGIVGNEVTVELERLWGVHPIDKIVLRRCEVKNQFIDYHLDHAPRTLQWCLNGDDEFEGGNLVYLTEAGPIVTQRRANTVFIHDNRIVHGVSTMTSGVRYSLYVLSK